MSLATRLSVFFLTILAVVLLGFSAALFLFQRWALLQQADERMTTALKALVASIEVEPDGVEWNPLEHRLEGFSEPCWRVLDHTDAIIDESPGFPAITTNCSNNYGPCQFPEKLIPLMILNGWNQKPLPVYGDGKNVRDWLYVSDHCAAVRLALAKGRPGEAYNIGGHGEMTNLDVIKAVCALLDEARPPHAPHEKLISFVKDRPGHDRRYAMDSRKIQGELGWKPQETFASGLRKTVEWYIDNMKWVDRVTSGEYQRWIETNYAKRGDV